MPKKEKVKRARAKPKNVVQKVTVNIGGRGGGGRKSTAPSGPPRPTPLQQATQFMQSFQIPRQGESMVQSAQMLQRLIDPINARLDAFVRQAGPVNNITMPPINISNPAINIRQPDIFMAPPNVSINQRFPDLFRRAEGQEPLRGYDINIQPFPNMGEHRDHNRQHVADLPDEPLVRPNAPLLLAGPMRMDDPHEDVPLNQVDPALVGKQEAQSSASLGKAGGSSAYESSEEEAEEEAVGGVEAGVRSIMDNIPITRIELDKMPLKRKKNTSSNTIVLTDLASYLGLALPRNILALGKNGVIDYILQNKKK